MKDLWKKIKEWFLAKALPWLKKSWMQIINLIIVMGAYSALDNANSSATWYVGLWGFVLLAYYIFWKLLGTEKMIKKSKTKKK